MTQFTKGLQNLFLALFFIPFIAQSQEKTEEKPVYNSLLWEITGNDMSSPSYLYGTMHVSQKVAFHLGAPFYQAIESCDMVALELNPETWMKDLAKTDLFQENYTESYGFENFYKDAFKMPLPKNREIGYQISSNDNLINGLLYRSTGYSDDFEEETYLDLYIFQTGKRMGKQVFSLEKYDEVQDYSRKAMLPDDDEEKVNYRKLNELFKETSPQEVLQDSYRKGNLNLVDSVSKLMNPSKNFHKYMIVERNIGMAHNMDSIMQAGTSLFTGVGAAHLPGDYGVIELLREKGYTLKPIERDLAGKSKYYQDKYDEIVVPFEYSNQDLEETYYRLDAPGTMYSMPSYGNFITYLHPNMSNGAYYWLKRIKTYDPLMEHSVDYTKSRIDSLLYENIPGDIITKKEISGEYYRGFDIVNKTRQGDKQRYRIYATPLEILIFKMGGNKEFTLQHGDQYFNSIELDFPVTNKMEKVQPAEGDFSVMLPTYHQLYRLRSAFTSGGPGVEYQAINKDGDYFIVRKTVLQDHEYIEEDQFELEQFVASIIEEDRYDTSMVKYGEYNGYPSVDASFSVVDSDKMLHSRFVINGGKYYGLTVFTEKTFDQCDDYLGSLTFEDFNYQKSFETFTDSLIGYQVKTVKFSDFEEIKKETQNMFYQADNKEDDGFDQFNLNSVVTSFETGEEIWVDVYRYNKFSYRENADSVWSFYIDQIQDERSMKLTKLNKYEQDSLQVMEAVAVDTASTRGIKLKMVLTNRRLYSISTTIDTLSAPSAFVTTTFETFRPLPDSTNEMSLFEKKNDLFFEHLESDDSTKIAQAFNFSYYVDLEEEDEARLMKHLNNFNFEHHGMAERADLIKMLRDIETKSSIAYLKNEYLVNEDTVTYQLGSLEALSNMEKLESKKVLGELLINYPTIPSEESEMSRVYRSLFDSLETAKVLFPDIMELGTFPEYRENNLNLLAKLIHTKKLKPRAIKKYKRQLISEAQIELKRQFASEEGGDDDKNVSWNIRNKMTRINYSLVDYAAIIAPWYEKDDKVKKFFSDVFRLKNKKTLIRIACVMLESSVPVDDAKWSELSADPKTSSLLLADLENRDLEKYFADEYRDPDKMSFSQLVTEYDFDNDSTDIEFIEKVFIDSKDAPGYYYFYRGKRKNYYEDEYNWAIYCNGPQPAEGEGVNAVSEFDEKSENIQLNEDYDDVLDDLKQKIEMKGRERFKNSNYYGGYGNGLY